MSLHDRIKDIFFPDPDLDELRFEVSKLKDAVDMLIRGQGPSTAEWVKSKDGLRADIEGLAFSQKELHHATLDLHRRLKSLEGTSADT